MKKLIVAIAIAFVGIGGTAVSAQINPLPDAPDPLPIECSETDIGTDVDGDGIADECIQFYVDQAPPTTAAPTTTVAVTVPVGELPRTGSGVSPILGIGALLLVGGGIVVVASRRRGNATTS